MSLDVDVDHRRGAFRLQARFTAAPGLTALFGRSGSGKTSLVNIVGGLIRPDRGRIAIDGQALVDTERGLFVPAHRRRIGYVFQDSRLFPHLSVRRNLLYGRWFVHGSGGATADLGTVIELLGIGHLLERHPDSLSGGEKQRVAIGRALLARPQLLLMDEPLASLDERRKAEILPYIERLRDELNIPILYVSHAIDEVLRLATQVVVLSAGRVVASGPPADVLSRLEDLPETRRADIGVVVDMEFVGQDDAFGLSRLRSASGSWLLPRLDARPGERVRARVRARDVMLALDAPHGVSALNVLPGTIVAIQPGTGADALVTLDCGGERLLAQVTRKSVEALDLAPGRRVHAVVKSVTFDGTATAQRLPGLPPAPIVQP